MTSPDRPRGSGPVASAAQEVTGRADLQGEGGSARPRTSLRSRIFIDEVAVARRLQGDHTVRLRIADREEAVRRLHAQGLNDRPIAVQLGISDRTVLRIRHRLGLPPLKLQHPLPEHGTASRYRLGCHCQPCRAANTAYSRKYQRRRRSA